MEEFQILLYASVSVWRLLTRCSEVTTVFCDLLCCKIINESKSLVDKKLCLLIELIHFFVYYSIL